MEAVSIWVLTVVGSIALVSTVVFTVLAVRGSARIRRRQEQKP